MSRQSIGEVLKPVTRVDIDGDRGLRVKGDAEIADALAAAVEDGPLIDQDRGLVVMKADPALAQFLADRADDIWESGDLRAADHADALEKAARLICHRCERGRGGRSFTNPPMGWERALKRLLCVKCQVALRREIDQFAGEGVGPSHSPESPSPVPAAPSLVERLRDHANDSDENHGTGDPSVCGHCNRTEAMREAADRIEELEAERIEYMEAAFKPRPVDLASDDRLIPLPGGRIAVAAQDLRAGDVVQGWPITELREDRFGCVALVVGSDFFSWPYGALVLLDKAADR